MLLLQVVRFHHTIMCIKNQYFFVYPFQKQEKKSVRVNTIAEPRRLKPAATGKVEGEAAAERYGKRFFGAPAGSPSVIGNGYNA